MASKFDNSKVDKISFDGDSRVQWREANLNGRKYGTYNLAYLHPLPKANCDNTRSLYIRGTGIWKVEGHNFLGIFPVSKMI